MADDPKNATTPEADGEAQAAASAPAAGGWSRRRYIALGVGSFLLAGLISLVGGGHFRREPLAKLRHVPLLGRLIPAPEAPKEEAPEAPVARLYPLPASEIGELIKSLQRARDDYESRRRDLTRHEERLKALQADLQRERDLLDDLMATLAQREAGLEAKRQVLDADTITATAEERKRLTKLARIYEAQAPTTAAAELEALNASAKDALAAKIMASMQEKKAAMVFDAMKPESALALKNMISALRFQQESPAAPGAAGTEVTP